MTAYTKDQITKRKFDVVIVGAGGSGMRASLQLARAGLNVDRGRITNRAVAESQHLAAVMPEEALAS